MGLLDIPVCVFILIFGVSFKNRFKLLNNYDNKILNQLFYFHIFFGVVFYFYVQGRGDAVYYWMHPKDLVFDQLLHNLSTRSYASDYVYFLNFFFSNTLELSFFTGSMMYCVLGYLAFVYYYAILKKVIPKYNFLNKIKILNIPVFPFFLFFPNLHFWSSGIGKDTLLFFCIALFVYSLFNIKKNIINIAISILISVFIRPHITMFLIVGFGVGYTFSGEVKPFQKFFMTLLFFTGFLLLFDYVLNFIKLESVDLESIEGYAANKSGVLKSKATSGVDISSYPYPLKILTYLYRPLFFDINNLIAIVASFENLFLLLLSAKLFKIKNIKYLKISNKIIKGSVVFLLIGTLTFSLILGNLGIMLREKNMFTPLFLITAYWLLSVTKNKVTTKI